MSTFTLTAQTASQALPILAKQIMRNGATVESRAGTTKELLYPHITLTQPWKREILTPHRKADIVAQIMETVWVLSGRNDIAFIQPYLKRAADFSDDGKTWRAGYGPRLRAFGHDGVDQLAQVVRVLKRSSGSRQAVMSIWDPEVDYDQSKDIPCNNWLHFLVRDGKLNLHVVIRSNDLIWGWSGINAFEWSALLEIVASLVGVQMGTLEFSISSLHVYERHFKKADILGKIPDHMDQSVPASPRTQLTKLADLDKQLRLFSGAVEHFQNGMGLSNTLSGAIDPLLASWLEVVRQFWADHHGVPTPAVPEGLKRLALAYRERPKTPPTPKRAGDYLKVAQTAATLHAEKHAVYGDSWRKRGEQVSIQANIARKIDRLGKEGAGDSNLDTAYDLLNYLVKYGLWLAGRDTNGVEHAADVAVALEQMSGVVSLEDGVTIKGLEGELTKQFEDLLAASERGAPRETIVKSMSFDAFALAVLRYRELQQNHRIPNHAERNFSRGFSYEETRS